MAYGKKMIVFIDPPSGWQYGFPKKAPDNLSDMSDEDFNKWLVKEGYPQKEVDYWTSSGHSTPPCRSVCTEENSDY